MRLDDRNPDYLEPLIKTSIEIKKKVVSNDFTESGLRKILNSSHITIPKMLNISFSTYQVTIIYSNIMHFIE